MPREVINVLAPGRCGNSFKNVISENMFQLKFMYTSCEIYWVPESTFDDKSALVEVMAWCHLTTGISVIKIRQSPDHLAFVIEIPIPEKMVFILKHGPAYNGLSLMDCPGMLPGSVLGPGVLRQQPGPLH